MNYGIGTLFVNRHNEWFMIVGHSSTTCYKVYEFRTQSVWSGWVDNDFGWAPLGIIKLAIKPELSKKRQAS